MRFFAVVVFLIWVITTIRGLLGDGKSTAPLWEKTLPSTQNSTFPPNPLRESWLQYTQIVKVVRANNVDTTPPNWLTKSDNEDIHFWLDEVLPYTWEKNYNEYLVIPYIWVVVPLNYIPQNSEDWKLLAQWKEPNWDRYFLSGANVYPWTASIGSNAGNSVIWGHSNYRLDSPWYYKTIFTKLPELTGNDEIRTYKKLPSGERQKDTFRVTKSFELRTFDATLVAQKTWERLLTLYTCVPIGTSDYRWIVQARFVHRKIMK